MFMHLWSVLVDPDLVDCSTCRKLLKTNFIGPLWSLLLVFEGMIASKNDPRIARTIKP